MQIRESRRLLAVALIFVMIFITLSTTNVYGLSEKEPNNKITQATTVKFGTEYTGTIKDYNDIDYYKITVPNDGFITIDATRKQAAGFTVLLNKNGSDDYSKEAYYFYEYWDNNDTRNTLKSHRIGLKKGTYYLIIDAYLGGKPSAGYSFKINYTKGEYEQEFNDEQKNAITIKVNKLYKGSLKDSDTDWYKFTLNKRGVVNFVFSKTGSISPSVHVYNSKINNTFIQKTYTSYNQDVDKQYDKYQVGLDKGTYYIKISDWPDTVRPNEYSFKVNFTPSDYWEIEPNGDWEKSTPLKINTWYKGSTKPGNYWDTDCYKFTLTKDTELFIEMSYPKTSADNHGSYEFSLKNASNHTFISNGSIRDESIEIKGKEKNGSGYSVLPWELSMGKNETQTSSIKLKKGTYYLRLYASSYYAKGATYSIKINTGNRVVNFKNVTITGITNKTFTGNAIGQNPKVTLNGKTLVKGTDYTLTYKNNVNVGTATVTLTGKGSYSGSVSRTFKITKGFVRASGKNRYQTAIAIGNKVKALNGNKKFNYIIVASGKNYPDALGGAYLAKVKNAPILLTTDGRETDTINFIKKNLNKGGTVYVLGGTGVVSNNFTKKLQSAGIKYSRKGGKNRYETNTSTLTLAGIKGKNLIVTTGKDFPDALISSATGNPIMIVSGDKLTNSQVKLLKKNKVKSVTIVSTGKAVSTKLEAALKKASGVKVNRVTASSRYALSKTVAEKYFKNPKNVVIATGKAFPDALSGGPLAIKLKAPILLADSSNSSYAKSYIKSKSVKQGYILGGTGAVSAKVESGLF